MLEAYKLTTLKAFNVWYFDLLLCENDDASVRRALCRLCKSAGYRVASFASAEAFLEAVGADQTHCLILDVHLPGRSGLQLQCDLLTAEKNLPIVFVTAYEDEQARAQALDNGAVEFVRKPLDRFDQCGRLS